MSLALPLTLILTQHDSPDPEGQLSCSQTNRLRVCPWLYIFLFVWLIIIWTEEFKTHWVCKEIRGKASAPGPPTQSLSLLNTCVYFHTCRCPMPIQRVKIYMKAVSSVYFKSLEIYILYSPIKGNSIYFSATCFCFFKNWILYFGEHSIPPLLGFFFTAATDGLHFAIINYAVRLISSGRIAS